MATELLYLEDSYLFSCDATILSCSALPSESDPQSASQFAVVLDRSIFHPQGGGQPNDQGFIVSSDGSSRFVVKGLKMSPEKHLVHVGSFECGEPFVPSTAVQLHVDEAARRLFARIHSGGHLMDLAFRALPYSLRPGKGYHFADSPYVEYVGVIPEGEREQSLQQLQLECDRLVQEMASTSTHVQTYSWEEACQVLGEAPEYPPPGNPVRIVTLVPGGIPCPCGGTHVKSVGDIGRLKVTKMQKKGKNMRVYYNVESQ